MSGSALFLVLLAGLVHATWNLAAKHASGGVAFSAISSVVAAVVWAPVGIPVLLRETPSWNGGQWAAVTGSAVLHVAYFATLLRGYQVGDLSVVYPVARGTGPLLTVLASIIFRGERPGWIALVGVFAILSGVLLIATGRGRVVNGGIGVESEVEQPIERGGKFVRSAKLATGLGYGVATGVSIAAYTLLDGHSVKELHVSPIGLDYGSNLVRVVLTLPIAHFVLNRTTSQAGSSQGLLAFARTHIRMAAIVGLLSPLAYVLVLQAAKTTDLSRVAPAREVSMLFAALFAGSLLKEEGLAVRMTGAVCIAVGVAAIALG